MGNKFSIFHIDGGIGKHIAATAVAKSIKSTHQDRDLIVICSYPEIFLNLEFIDRVYRIGTTPYFYDDFIDGKDSIIFRHEPYFTTEHIHKELPLIENWCKLYNLDFSNEHPELIFNLRQQQFGHNKWTREKPIFVIHTNGGAINDQPFPYSWCRDMPYDLGQSVANHYINEAYHVIQICRNSANILHGVEAVTEQLSNMELFYLLRLSDKRLLIDSCMQHAAAAMNLPSTVLWIGTVPNVFGYTIHNNIQASLSETVKLPDSYLFDYNFNGFIHECPIIEPDIFDLSEIIDSINGI